MIRSAIVALAAAAVLTACVGGSDPKPAASTPASTTSAARAGDCFADADSKLDPADPDFSTKVKCTKRHLYEVTGVSAVPVRFLEPAEDPEDPDATVRERLLAPEGGGDRAFAQHASAVCSDHLWRTMGVDADAIRSGRAHLSDIGAFPAAAGIIYRHTLTPEPAWTKGEHRLICFAEFRDPSEDQGAAAPASVSSYNLTTIAGRFLSSHFPVERRRCYVQSDEYEGEVELGPCTQAHESEVVFTYNARLAFGTRFVKEAMRADEDDEFDDKDDKVMDRMQKVCRDMLPKVLAKPIDSELFVSGWSAVDQFAAWYPSTDLTYEAYDFPVECELWPSDEALVFAPGTVVHRPDRPELEDRSYRSDA
ncbi:MAG: hypothetical protein QOH68_2054 [Nocardioidaceae bacterium]|nr:hypothetical protein [Nocardioidaceae bacterium]